MIELALKGQAITMQLLRIKMSKTQIPETIGLKITGVEILPMYSWE